MPINDQNQLSALREALLYFNQHAVGKITLEYIALNGFNDQREDALKLAAFCRGLPLMVNIIEYNPVEGFEMKGTPARQLDKLASYLIEQGIHVTLRRSRGRDIDAACGQLANRGKADFVQ